jgi:hypothetical protein
LTASLSPPQAQMLLELVKDELACPRYVIFMPAPSPHTV